jgi:FkbM family methyltransferase
MSRFTPKSYKHFLRTYPALYKISLKLYAKKCQKRVSFAEESILVISKKNRIRLHVNNINYTREVIDFFEFYFDSVVPTNQTEQYIEVDFSKKSSHTVQDFPLMPIIFPTVSEPLSTIQQYLSILDLKAGETVLDLGAYSGFSSIVFATVVGDGVVAVEADPTLRDLISENLEIFHNISSTRITMYPYGVYSTNGSFDFIGEGTMAGAIVDEALDSWNRAKYVKKVDVRTLSSLARDLKLTKVDVIKADIEGAEYDALLDAKFFDSFHPRILIEPIAEHGPKGARSIIDLLRGYGYVDFKYFVQDGGKSPLIYCF